MLSGLFSHFKIKNKYRNISVYKRAIDSLYKPDVICKNNSQDDFNCKYIFNGIKLTKENNLIETMKIHNEKYSKLYIKELIRSSNYSILSYYLQDNLYSERMGQILYENMLNDHNKLYYSLQYTIYEFLILAKYNDNLFNNIIVLMYINNKLYIDYNFIKIGDLIITDNCDFYFKVLKTIKTNNLIELTDHEKKILDINEKSKIIMV